VDAYRACGRIRGVLIMTWFVVNWSGQTYTENLTGAAEKTLTLLGIHGYATEAEAQAHPQTMNVLQAAAGGAQALAGVSGSATDIPTPGGVVAGAATGAAAATTTLGWLKSLFTRANAIRLAEGVLGLALVLVAVAKLGEGTAIGSAAKKVPFI
jgi:hypothetical protein